MLIRVASAGRPWRSQRRALWVAKGAGTPGNGGRGGIGLEVLDHLEKSRQSNQNCAAVDIF